jgi:hypothetical protein
MNNYLSFYRDCYKEDRSKKFIRDIYSNKFELLTLIDGKDDLGNGLLPFISIDSGRAEALKKKSKVYEKEKELIFGSLILSGVLYSESGEKKFYCSPIFTSTANIELENSKYLLSLNNDSITLNLRMLESIAQELGTDLPKNIKIDFRDDSYIDSGVLSRSVNIIESIIEDPDIIEVNNYPKLLSKEKFKKEIRSIKAHRSLFFKLLPISFVALIDRRSEAQGVLDEMEEIIGSERKSSPLNVLFGNGTNSLQKSRSQKGVVASILSQQQEKIIESSSKYNLLQITGPPGTGKSYTIATLALEFITRGKSVLIASRTDQAVDVIASKIEDQLEIGNSIVRGGKSNYLRKLKSYLQDLLSGVSSEIAISKSELSGLLKDLYLLEQQISDYTSKIENQARKELKVGKLFSATNLSIIQKLYLWYYRKSFSLENNLVKIIPEFHRILDSKILQSKRVLNATRFRTIEQSLRTNREQLNLLLSALRSRTGAKKDERFSQISIKDLLQIFPIWLVNLNDIHKTLPLQTEMFDLAIIDEATQCDITSCLPILQRASKAIIVGDPKQLRHISFLSRSKQQEFADLHDIENLPRYNYRSNSILDLAQTSIKTQDAVVFLDEHYRSLPKIINFSNLKFYNNRLKIMTEKPDKLRNNSVELCKTKGIRKKSGYNTEECSGIIEKIDSIIADSKSFDESTTIGILSPFRSQVDYISNEILSRYSTEILDKYKMMIGTAHTFQGEERDIMFLSFVLDDSSHPSAFRFLELEDVFNVTVTRAKNKQYIYHSFDRNILKSGSLLREYLDYLSDFPNDSLNKRTEDSTDDFASEVAQEMEAKGFDSLISYSMSGFKMDIILFKNDKFLSIDLIGYPGDLEGIYTLDRYKMFRRAGINIFPLTYSAWNLNRKETVDLIVEAFGRI